MHYCNLLYTDHKYVLCLRLFAEKHHEIIE